MSASLETLQQMVRDEVGTHTRWVVIMIDWFDMEPYPVTFRRNERAAMLERAKPRHQVPSGSDWAEEVYDLTKDLDEQFRQRRAWETGE